MSPAQKMVMLEHLFDKSITITEAHFGQGNLIIVFTDSGGNRFKQLFASNGRQIELEV